MSDDSDRDLFVGPPGYEEKYRLVRLEGRGGEASLWRAEVDLAGEPELVAVKILHAEHRADLSRLSRRWAEQAELLRFITHPGVVGVREHFHGEPPHPSRVRRARWRVLPPKGALYLVMNWVPGTTLRDWLLLHPGREGTLEALRLLDQLADTLEMLHDGKVTPSGRAMVHGDLSPGNVVIDRRGRAVLVDFGMVQVAPHVTAAPAGTPGFTAPEVWTHGRYTAAADRYGFAALGFYVLLGSAPAAERGAIAAQLMAHPFLGAASSEQIEDVLEGFSPDPDRRPTPTAWLQALRGSASTSARSLGPRSDRSSADAAATAVAPPVTDRTLSVPQPRRAARAPHQPAPADDVATRLADCWDGPGFLVRVALAGGEWDVSRSWWSRTGAGRVFCVKLRDRLDDGWVVVEMLLRSGGRSELVWANGTGGAMTECTSDLARWLAPC